jgi:pimeloyl-ACP methyl ester carboxylesterase
MPLPTTAPSRHSTDPATLFNTLTEAPRLLLEATQLYLDWPTLLQRLAPGDGHPVLFLPGFAGGDASTLALRRLFSRLNYRTVPWDQGTNTGNTDVLAHVVQRTAELHQSSGCRVSLVGQSLGGVFAREVARRVPDSVRCVVGLGSPFAAHPPPDTAAPSWRGLRSAVRRPRRVPTTAIYSKGDGVVPWRHCMVHESDWTENVETRGSHTGMAHNPDVIRIVADRLAQRPGTWLRYDSAGSGRPSPGLPDLRRWRSRRA